MPYIFRIQYSSYTCSKLECTLVQFYKLGTSTLTVYLLSELNCDSMNMVRGYPDRQNKLKKSGVERLWQVNACRLQEKMKLPYSTAIPLCFIHVYDAGQLNRVPEIIVHNIIVIIHKAMMTVEIVQARPIMLPHVLLM